MCVDRLNAKTKAGTLSRFCLAAKKLMTFADLDPGYGVFQTNYELVLARIG